MEHYRRIPNTIEAEQFSAETFDEFSKMTNAADVAEVKHGHWVGVEYDGYADGLPVYDLWECSECGEEVSGENVPDTHPLSKYDKIVDELTAYAGKKRDCKMCQARAEKDRAQREYTAYIDGATDAIRQIECQEKMTKENENG